MENAPTTIIQTPPPIMTGSGKSKTIMISGVVALIILLAAAGAGAYYYYFPSPERVLSSMSRQFAAADTHEYAGEVKATMKSAESANAALPYDLSGTLTFSGQSDTRDFNNPKASLALGVTAPAALPGQALNLELRIVDRVVYFKLNEVPNLGFFDASAFVNQWLKIEPEEIKEQLETGSASPETSAAWDKELTPEQIAEIKKIRAQSRIMVVTETLPSEKVGTVNTHHYRFMINKEEAERVLAEIYRVVNGQPISAEEAEAVDRLSDLLTLTNGEIWIGKADRLPHKIHTVWQLEEPSESPADITFEINLELKNINQPLQIEAPAGAKTLEELLSSLGASQALLPSLGTTEASDTPTDSSTLNQARDARIKSNIVQLRVLAEVFYDANQGSYAGFDACTATPSAATCKQADVATTVADLNTDLASLAGGVAQLEINTTASDFCISHPLSLETSFMCADATGQLNENAATSCGGAAVRCPP